MSPHREQPTSLTTDHNKKNLIGEAIQKCSLSNSSLVYDWMGKTNYGREEPGFQTRLQPTKVTVSALRLKLTSFPMK